MTGKEFRSIRLALGYKLYTLADRLEVSLSTIYRAERAERVPVVMEYAVLFLRSKVESPVARLRREVDELSICTPEAIAVWDKEHPAFTRMKRGLKFEIVEDT